MSNLEKVLSEFKAGKFIVVTDDENRENEADLILLADKATPENIGFMFDTHLVSSAESLLRKLPRS